MTKSIFISYRREDTRNESERLFFSLKEQFRFDSVFFDTSSILPGSAWPSELQHAVESAKIVIVVIGPNWLGVSKQPARRIDLENDWVRKEVEAALERQRLNRQKAVIPLLVNGADMPQAEDLPNSIRALAELQAFKITDADWENQIVLFMVHLDDILEGRSARGNQRRNLNSEPSGWKEVSPPLSAEYLKPLSRQYEFDHFQAVVSFLTKVAGECDASTTNLRWEFSSNKLTISVNPKDNSPEEYSKSASIMANCLDIAYWEYEKTKQGP